MELNEIYSRLCTYDKRNPNYVYIDFYEDDEQPQPRTNCSCDNCFYGRDELALEILRLKGQIDGTQKD